MPKQISQSNPRLSPNEMGHLPPQAHEVEEVVLGALMVDQNAYSIVEDIIRPDIFYSNQHQRIIEAIIALANQAQPINSLTVTEKLKELGTLEEAGGVLYIGDLTRRVATAAHLRYHLRLLIQKATARELIRVANEIADKSYDDTQDIQDIVKKAEDSIFDIAQRGQKRDVVQIDSVISEAFERMRLAAKNEGNISGIPSGFTELDNITSGWQRSDLIVIAARPSMGKTAFVISMAKNMVVNYHIPVALFSLEMQNVEIINRLIMNVCEIESEKIKNGKLTPQEWKRLESKINDLYGVPLLVDDTPGMSIQEFRSKAKQIVKTHHVQLIIVDYLQLLTTQVKYGNREQEVSSISRSLKAIAKDLDIPIIALSQMNRASENRSGIEGKKPQLSDLRESGAIEQDADIVCFIHRPEYYHIYTDEKSGKDLRGLALISIAKHRNGAVDDIWLRFRKRFAKFQNEDEAYDEYGINDIETISIQSSMGLNGVHLEDGKTQSPF